MTFTFNTERSPLLNAEQLKDYFKKYISESKKEIIVCSAYITTPGIQWFKENIEDKTKIKRKINDKAKIKSEKLKINRRKTKYVIDR